MVFLPFWPDRIRARNAAGQKFLSGEFGEKLADQHGDFVEIS
jgi:hypothetical protein